MTHNHKRIYGSQLYKDHSLGEWQNGSGVTLHKTDKVWWRRVWPWIKVTWKRFMRWLDD